MNFVRCYATTAKLHSNAKQHIYKNVYNWNNQEEFVQTLLKNVLYNEGGLVCINKPYGVGSLRPPPDQKRKGSVILGETGYYLSEALPEVAKHLNFKSLTIVKAAERYTSGVTFLAARSNISRKVEKCRRRAVPLQKFSEKYLVLTDGVPNPKYSEEKVFGITFEEGGIPPTKHPVIVEEWSNRAVKLDLVQLVNVKHKTIHIAEKGRASLVEVCASRNKWNFLRVYMSYLMSPILGDHYFGSRVRTALNKRVRVHPASDTARLPQSLPDDVLELLRLRPGQETLIPLHAHLQEATLIKYFDKNNDLIIRAPVSETFSWSCSQLGLKLPRYEELEENSANITSETAVQS